MKRSLALLVALLSLVLTTGLAVAVTRSHLEQGPVYSVAELRAHLADNPGAWVGRTVRVHAVAASPCVAWMGGPNPACWSWQLMLLDLAARDAAMALSLRVAPPSPLVVALRRLPIAGQWVLPPQCLHRATVATYRIRLLAASTNSCAQPPCYAALLPDATP